MFTLQLDELQSQNKKLETQAVSVQHRLTNLQRRQELTERQRTMETVSAKAKAETQRNITKEMGESKSSVAKQPGKVRCDICHVNHTCVRFIQLAFLFGQAQENIYDH